ncbi:MAG: tRNA guanosine(34) transglycosylase Tgt [Clostridia bacterium]|nr:tRNA guanosine(34) transglycosylase Tgt [Clostridia bacterium]
MAKFTLHKKEGAARLGTFSTVHGDIQTPVFMNVGTSAAVKGGISTDDLREIRCQVELSNTYHLHVRPGDDVIYQLGGIHKFFNWDKPVLTDSGGFQVFSLSQLRNIKEEGVTFASHFDGTRIFMGPEESMQIQSNIASTIAMAFDECCVSTAEKSYIGKSIRRTTRWLDRCIKEMARLNSLETTINPDQLLFGINQGGVYDDLRIEHMKQIREFDLPGYAIGGLAVGESADEMYRIIEAVEPYMPEDRPRYLMGVGTPINILEAVDRGVDFFDCVMPSRNARHGNLFTHDGLLNLNNNKFKLDPLPIDPHCDCKVCRTYSRAYIRHLFKARELLAMRLCVYHNLYFYNRLMEQIREAIANGTWASFKKEAVDRFSRRV